MEFDMEKQKKVAYSTNPRIIICIPAFNESKNIADIIKKTQKYATEVIVCDDGSSDNTSEVANKSGATVIRHSSNRGYGSAISTLFRTAREKDADVMVTIDSDGQHDPDKIPDLISPLTEQGIDIVIGSRFLTLHEKDRIPAYRSFGIKTITRLAQVASYGNLTDAQSGFRAYSKTALMKINLYEEGMAVSTEILLRAKEKSLQITEVPITVNYDVERPSTHNPITHGIGVLYSLMQFISLRHPLAFYGLPGIVLLVIAAVFTSKALELFSTTRYISTNLILVSVGTAIVGIVLLATGAILYTITALLKGRIKEI
ncbi:MAG TPA: glycosyltransferase family 2 protein [Nitrososphaeraceae archaeon]